MEHFDKLLGLIDQLNTLVNDVAKASESHVLDQMKLQGIKLYQELGRQLNRSAHEFRRNLATKRADAIAQSFKDARALARETILPESKVELQPDNSLTHLDQTIAKIEKATGKKTTKKIAKKAKK